MRRWWPFRRSGLSCREVVELVTDYLEGSLPAADRRRFEAHLSACDGCTAYLTQMRAMLHLLGSIPEDAVPPELERELLSAFRGWKRGDR